MVHQLSKTQIIPSFLFNKNAGEREHISIHGIFTRRTTKKNFKADLSTAETLQVKLAYNPYLGDLTA